MILLRPDSGAQVDLLKNNILTEGVKEKTRARTPSRPDTIFDRLVAAGERLMSVIHKNRGGANKSLAKFTDQINSLSDKWER